MVKVLKAQVVNLLILFKNFAKTQMIYQIWMKSLQKSNIKEMKCMQFLRKRTNIIVDTNLWISFLISRNFEKLDYLFTSRKVCLLFSERLFAEFLRVAGREKFRKYFSESVIDELSTKMKKVAKIVNTTSVQTQCRDPKDNFLLELAIDGKADYLITGDKDLLDLKTVNKTKIVKIEDFIKYF